MSQGGGSVPSSRSQTSTTETIVPDWVQAQIEQNIQTANELSSQDYQAPPGPTLAGFTPDQFAAFQAIRNMQGQAGAQIGQAASSITNLPATIASLENPYTAGQESTVLQNALRQMALTRMQISSNAAKQGTLGGTREAIDQAMNVSNTQASVGAQTSQLAENAWLQATQAAFQRAGLAAGLSTAQQTELLQAIGALDQTGQAQQTFTQAGYSQALQEWQAAQNYPYQQLALTQSALAGSPYGASVTSSQPYSSSGGSSALGMIASAIPILAGLPGAASTIGSGASWLGGALGLTGAADAAGAAGAASFAAEAGLGSAAAAGLGADAAIGGTAAAAAGGSSKAAAAPFIVAAAA